MSDNIIDGKAFAAFLREKVAKQVPALPRTPALAVVLVGDDPASQVYVRNKVKQTMEVGMISNEIRLPVNCSQAELLLQLSNLNNDASVHGILVQLPLPNILMKVLLLRLSPLKKMLMDFTQRILVNFSWGTQILFHAHP